jgi:hypothetical protein
MKGENRKSSRQEAAIVRRLKNLEKYTAAKDLDKAKKAFRDIACTCRNLEKEVSSEARACLNKLGIKEEDILISKVKAKEEVIELPEKTPEASQE